MTLHLNLSILALQTFLSFCLGFQPIIRGVGVTSRKNKSLIHQKNENHHSISIKSSSSLHNNNTLHSSNDIKPCSPISMNIEELSSKLGGKGRALAVWDCYRIGLDPLYFYGYSDNDDDNDDNNKQDSHPMDYAVTKFIHINNDKINGSNSSSREYIRSQKLIPVKRQTEGLGNKALELLSTLYSLRIRNMESVNQNINDEMNAMDYKHIKHPFHLGLEESIATLEQVHISKDETIKLLLKLHNSLYIETVIIPWKDRQRSTLCVSSQVGCRQGCTFCATGKMGKLYDLTSDEILIQLYYAKKVCRVWNVYDVDNIVFMGMGEPTDNIQSVIKATEIMTDKQCFSIAPTKVTISTVAPTPKVFDQLIQVPAVLAWSVHAVRDSLRKELVPTTKYSMEELRAGLVEALLKRPNKNMRTCMLEVTLIDNKNDGIIEANELVQFALDMMDMVPSMKLIINLIPFNDIGHMSFRKPSMERVLIFQRILVEKGILAYIRTTRGDDESSACGQLTTKKLSSY